MIRVATWLPIFLVAIVLLPLTASAQPVVSLRQRETTPRPIAPPGASRIESVGKQILGEYQMLYQKRLDWRVEQDAIEMEQRRINRAENGGFASQVSVPFQQKLRLSTRRTENNQLDQRLSREEDFLKQRYQRWLQDIAAQRRRN